VSPEQLTASIPDVHRLRKAVRAQAASVQANSLRWLDQADALKIRRPPRGARGGEYDWIDDLDPREKSRLSSRWFSDAAIDAPDVVMERARASGVFVGDSVDDFMDQWLFHTRRVDAAAAVRQGRLPAARRMGGVDAGDISTTLEEQGLDLRRVLAVDVEDAAGYLAARQADEVAERAESLLGAAARADDPPWRMSFQAWEREVRLLEETRGEAAAAGRQAVEADLRYRQLVPEGIDIGQDYEVLYAEIVETARVAGMDIAPHAVIPWAA
jgi:hypothetical protein